MTRPSCAPACTSASPAPVDRATATVRLFVAVWPPSHVVEQLAALSREGSTGLRWIEPENVHVTLRFLGEAEVEEVHAGLDDAELPSATASLGPRVIRLGREAVVVPVDGLGELAAVVSEATADIGRRPEHRSFRGHMTIARLRSGGRCELVGRPIDAAFAVRDVALVRSVLHPSGARYETIGRWAVSAG